MTSQMKPLLPFLAMLLVLTSCQDDGISPDSELLKNIGFESGGSTPSSWQAVDPFESGNFSFEWSTEEVYEGDRALKISANESNRRDFGYWVSAISFDTDEFVGEELELSVWVKGNMSGEGAALILRGDQEGNDDFVSFVSSLETEAFTGEFEWTQIKVSDSIPTGIDSFSVFLVLADDTVGEVFFDEVSLRKK